MANREHLVDLAHLLNVEIDTLERALLSRVIAAGGQVVEKDLTVSDALYARDAFAKVQKKKFSLKFYFYVYMFMRTFRVTVQSVLYVEFSDDKLLNAFYKQSHK